MTNIISSKCFYLFLKTQKHTLVILYSIVFVIFCDIFTIFLRVRLRVIQLCTGNVWTLILGFKKYLRTHLSRCLSALDRGQDKLRNTRKDTIIWPSFSSPFSWCGSLLGVVWFTSFDVDPLEISLLQSKKSFLSKMPPQILAVLFAILITK